MVMAIRGCTSCGQFIHWTSSTKSSGSSSAGGGTSITSPVAESMRSFRIVRYVPGAFEEAYWLRGTRRRGASGVAPYIANPIASTTATVVSHTRHSAA